MDTEKNNDKTCSDTQALFLHRLEHCHEMWFLNAERTQTHLKNSPLHSVPILGVYNSADVFAGHIFSPLRIGAKYTRCHILFYKQNTREAIFFLRRKKCIPSVINDGKD